MPIITGGIVEEWGPPRLALRAVQQEIGRFAPPESDEDYVVDIAFRSWNPQRPPEFVGVEAGPVARTHRRFIVWHSVPVGLATPAAVMEWPREVLPETARLVREHVPTKSKAYPAEFLASEVEALAASLGDPDARE